jgi:hypothetical protein
MSVARAGLQAEIAVRILKKGVSLFIKNLAFPPFIT